MTEEISFMCIGNMFLILHLKMKVLLKISSDQFECPGCLRLAYNDFLFFCRRIQPYI